MNDLDWNDLRYVVSVKRNGSAASAARDLRVSHATVLRRLQVLEHHIGTPLFTRSPGGYVPTEAGKRLAEVGARIEGAIIDASRSIEGESTDLSGTINFTTTDSLASEVMPEILAQFRHRQPRIRVEMRVTNDQLDLVRRDADVTLRPTAEPPESWVGMRLVRLDWGIYASTECLERQPSVPWTELDFIMLAGRLASGPFASWLHARVTSDSAAGSSDSFVALRRMAEAGVGATLLPKMMAEHTELELLEMVPTAGSSDIWILTHETFRNTARVHVFMEHVAQMLRQRRARFEFA